MPARLDLAKRAEIQAAKEQGLSVRKTAKDLELSARTVLKYFHGEMEPAEEKGFSTLGAHAKQRRVDGWIAVSALAQQKAVEGLEDIEVGTANDFKSMITAAAIAEDKLALIENRLPGQQPLALQLLVLGGDVNIDGRTLNISDRELEQLAEAKLTREGRGGGTG